jgi:hypothetical protein
MTYANRAIFGIKHIDMRDCWMTECGNLQGQTGAILFETREEAQRFLDTRRLRRGFRPRLAVAEVTCATVAELAAFAREASVTAIYEKADHRPLWAARAAYLETFLPLAA